MRIEKLTTALLLSITPVAAGCAAAAVAGAGAATGIYLTTRGAEGVVDGDLRTVTGRTEAVMRDLGLRVTERKIEYDDNEVEFKAKTDDLDVSIDLEAESARTTRVQVEARRNLVEWDKDYAQMVIRRIVAKR